jgi:hypothetical protein
MAYPQDCLMRREYSGDQDCGRSDFQRETMKDQDSKAINRCLKAASV